MSECNHDCSSCSEKCDNKIVVEPQNKGSNVKNVIAVISGKGGVGKSSVTSMLAVYLNKIGKKTAVLDADITGPSIPKAFGVKGQVYGDENNNLYPAETATGIKLMSLNLLVESETTPVVWRGPVIAGCVKQFWTDVVWGDVDVMIVDCPPGTGDVPLTVFQSLPIKGIVVVTTPQDLVSLIVEKAVNMADMMHVPILGVVENMSYFVCPDCNKKHYLFGESKQEKIACVCRTDNALQLPLSSDFATKCDEGKVEEADVTAMKGFVENILKQL